jgi:hypothetical protein
LKAGFFVFPQSVMLGLDDLRLGSDDGRRRLVQFVVMAAVQPLSRIGGASG